MTLQTTTVENGQASSIFQDMQFYNTAAETIAAVQSASSGGKVAIAGEGLQGEDYASRVQKIVCFDGVLVSTTIDPEGSGLKGTNLSRSQKAR